MARINKLVTAVVMALALVGTLASTPEAQAQPRPAGSRMGRPVYAYHVYYWDGFGARGWVRYQTYYNTNDARIAQNDLRARGYEVKCEGEFLRFAR